MNNSSVVDVIASNIENFYIREFFKSLTFEEAKTISAIYNGLQKFNKKLSEDDAIFQAVATSLKQDKLLSFLSVWWFEPPEELRDAMNFFSTALIDYLFSNNVSQ